MLFQLVEKHGEILFNLIKDKVDPKRKVFFVYGGTETDDREKLEQSQKSRTTQLLSLLSGRLALVSIFVIYTTLFLVLKSPL